MKRRSFLASGLCFAALPANAMEQATVDWVNALRRPRGRKMLRWSPVLAQVAQGHADDMAQGGFFDHAGSDGSDIGDRMRRAGYRWCAAAENIAKGQRSLEEVLKDWRGSRGHRRNMLNQNVTEIGLARAEGNIWVMVLGTQGC